MIDNKILEEILNKRLDGEDNEKQIIKELKDDVKFLVPVKQCLNLESGGTSVQFIFAEKNEGVYVLAFTSEEELAKGMQNIQFIILTFAEIIALVSKKEEISGIILNPFSVSYRIPDTITGKKLNQQLLIGEPIEYPIELLKLFVEYFDRNNDISKAWFAIMQQGYNEPEFLLVLEGDYETTVVYETIRNIAIPKLSNIGMAIVNSKDIFGEKVANKYFPFWDRYNGLNYDLIQY